MTIPFLTENAIRREASPESFRRGQEYYRGGYVLSVVQRGSELQGEVEGSSPEPYRVVVRFDSKGVAEAACTCPYDWGGWCKHVVAVLLSCVNGRERIEVRPSLEQLLAGLDREQLQALVQRLAAHEPALIDYVESEIALLEGKRAGSAKGGKRAARLDTAPFRRRVRDALHSLDRMRASEAYWYVGGVADAVREVIGQAQEFIGVGDGRNALDVLKAITEEYMKGWTNLDDSDGELGAVFDDLGAAWADALLTAGLNGKERDKWAGVLADWMEELGDYGVEEGFHAACWAAERGWDDAVLQQVLQGAPRPRRGKSGGPALDGVERELAPARLRVLERQERFDEYLRLARAAGLVTEYLGMLVRRGRVQEAADEAPALLGKADEALGLALALHEHGETAAALRIAEHGLGLAEPREPLAVWLIDLAEAKGKRALALRAALAAFGEEPGLALYRKVQELSGRQWPQRRGELLERLRKAGPYWNDAQVEVFLYEDLVEDAIAAVKGPGDPDLLVRVADAAIARQPEWVVKTARKEADAIMDAGASQHYARAAEWLRRARDAWRASGKDDRWRAYIGEVRTRHQRKYKLMALLKAL